MMLPKEIEIKVIKTLSSKFNKEVRVFSCKALVGGDINSAVKLETSHGDFFLKWNISSRFPEMFNKEAKGLNLLENAKCIRIPKVIAAEEVDNFSFLILEFIKIGSGNFNSFNNLGKGLACLHKNSTFYFGLDHDNYMGSLTQSNKKHDNWICFFIEERIEPQLKLAYDNEFVDGVVLKASEHLFRVLNEIIPEESSAMLHGDLWSGNFLMDDKANPCLIDPAVYYGHRETDIAMTKLFGGFSASFYSTYNEHFKLEKGWDKRIDIFNLYPLLIHLNLFGTSYLGQVKSILQRF